MMPSAATAVMGRSGPDVALAHLEHVVRPGDVVATRHSWKLPELVWSVAVRTGAPYRVIPIRGIADTAGIALGRAPRTGRTWVLDWSAHPLQSPLTRCAPNWSHHGARVLCLLR